MLASSLGRQDQGPNTRIAETLAARPDPVAVAELAAALGGESERLAGDATKALYELGVRDPSQVTPHADAVAALLSSRNNRLVWGAVTVLHAISDAYPQAVSPHVGALIPAVASGSVITQDHGIGALAATEDPAALSFVIQHLRACPARHVPLRAERAAPHMDELLGEFRDAVESRLPEQSPGGLRRLRAVLRSLPSPSDGLT